MSSLFLNGSSVLLLAFIFCGTNINTFLLSQAFNKGGVESSETCAGSC